MPIKETPKTNLSLMESVDKLFLRFLLGKNKIYREGEYNDGLSTDEFDNKDVDPVEDSMKDALKERILLDVEKERVMREAADKRLKDKRHALLLHYFQQSLLKVINSKLANNQNVILEQLQLRDSTSELLQKLLAGEPRYSTLASLLDCDIGTRNRLLSLVGSEDFMSSLGRTQRKVRDTQSAIGLIGVEILRYLVPAILFKHRISTHSYHNPLFARKLWRYEMTLGQTCTALLLAENYRRPYEGMLLSVMVNFAYVASYHQFLSSFEYVRTAYLNQMRERDEKLKHDFFYNIQTDAASLQALLISQSNLKLSLSISNSLFSKSFPHLVNALKEEVDAIPFEVRSKMGKVLFKAIRFAKFDQLRASRLFKPEWLEQYLKESQIDPKTYKALLRQELFRFKPIW
jgi:hypothetical protein